MHRTLGGRPTSVRFPAAGSHPELPQVMIEVLPRQPAPARGGQGPKEGMRGRAGGCGQSLDQVFARQEIRGPVRRGGRQHLRAGLRLTGRCPHRSVDNEPLEEGATGKGSSGTRRDITQTHTKLVREVAEDPRSRECPPLRPGSWCQRFETSDDRRSVGIGADRRHLTPGPKSLRLLEGPHLPGQPRLANPRPARAHA